MAAPAYRSSSHVVGGFHTSLDPATPSGTANDDIILYVAMVQANAPTITTPSGYTIVDTATNGTGHKAILYYKRAASEGATVGGASFTNNWSEGMALSISGCITSGSPIDAHDVQVNTSNSTSTPACSVTTTGADRLLVWIGIDEFGATWSAVASGFTQRESYGGAIIAAGDLAQAVSGGSGSLTGTSGTSDHKSAFLVALTPAGGAAATPLFSQLLTLGVG